MCMIDMADEPWKVYAERKRIARKPHTCCECGHNIKPGEPYLYCTGFLDVWQHYHVCDHCVQGPCRWLTEQCGGYLLCGVQEDLEEHWGERHELGISGADILAFGRLIIEMRSRGRVATQERSLAAA